MTTASIIQARKRSSMRLLTRCAHTFFTAPIGSCNAHRHYENILSIGGGGGGGGGLPTIINTVLILVNL